MIDRRRLLTLALAAAASGRAYAQPSSGKVLRAAWLAGNPVQAREDAQGHAYGPAIDLGQALAQRLGLTFEAHPANGPAGVIEQVRGGKADLGFVAYDPARAEGLLFTPPYLMSLNSYVVRDGSAISGQDQVDRAGVKVGAIPTDAGGLYLQRTLKSGVLTPQASVEAGAAALLKGEIDVMAANGQRLADLLATTPGLRLLPGSFFGVPQTIAVRNDNPDLAAKASALVREMIGSGAVARSIDHWRLAGAAPATL